LFRLNRREAAKFFWGVKSPRSGEILRSGEIFLGCFLPNRREAAEKFYLHPKVKKKH
jgi:hypothetical protein